MRGQHPSIHAQRTPDKAAYIMADSGEVVSYKDLDSRTNQGAQLFRHLGLKTQDVILIFAENHARFLEVLWAAQRSGLYFTAVSWHLTAPEIDYILHDSGAKVFIASARFSAVAREVAEGLDAQKSTVRLVSLGGEISGFEAYEALRDQQPSTPISDEVAGMPMLYTSGTTGKPKGVKRPFPNDPIDLVHQGEIFFHREGFDENSVGLAAGPLYHTAPMNNTMRNQRFGGTGIVVDKFDPEELLGLIEKHGVKQLTCVPTHFVRLLKLPEQVRQKYDLSSLEIVLHTAAPCPLDVKHKMIEWLGPILFEYYGGTEGIGGTLVRSKEWLKYPGTIGKPVVGNVYAMNEDTWEEVPIGEEGVLYFDVTGNFRYHNDEAKTKSVTSPQGWRTLGDIGYVNEQGYVFLTDRKANMIISGGVNIYPQEAENRLLSHPKVVDAAVFGIPHPDFGQQVKAVVQLADSEGVGDQMEVELIEFCKMELSSIKCPRSIDFTERLPRQANGKLYKRLLQDHYL